MADIRQRARPVKFFFTMNMQSRSGNPTHQVIGEVRDIYTLDEMVSLMQDQDFVIVEEFYKKPEGGYYSQGETILNTMHIGKVRAGT